MLIYFRFELYSKRRRCNRMYFHFHTSFNVIREKEKTWLAAHLHAAAIIIYVDDYWTKLISKMTKFISLSFNNAYFIIQKKNNRKVTTKSVLKKASSILIMTRSSYYVILTWTDKVFHNNFTAISLPTASCRLLYI